MIGASIKNNLKSILRDPTMLLAILAAFILCFMNGFDWYTGPGGVVIDSQLYLNENLADHYGRQTFLTFSSVPFRTMLMPFMGIVVALDFFKDKRLGTFDLITTTQLSFLRYYVSKILSYYIVAVFVSFTITILYGTSYIILRVPPDPFFDWMQVVITGTVAMIVLYSSVLWIPIAWSVFLFALTGNHIPGIVFNCVYRYIPGMMVYVFSFSIWEHYIHAIPASLLLYLQDWIVMADEKRFALVHKLFTAGTGAYIMYTSFLDALIAYFVQIGIAAVLLTSSYFLLKKRLRRSS